MEMLEFLFVPVILFLIVVAPVWIVMHYRSVKGSLHSLSAHDLETVEQMLKTLDQMSERIQALESILQHDHPDWRKHAQPTNKESPS